MAQTRASGMGWRGTINDKIEWQRIWPGFFGFGLPIVSFLGIMYLSVLYLLPLEHNWVAIGAENFKTGVLERVANDLEGRFLFGAATGLLRFAAIVALVVAFVVLAKTFGAKIGTMILSGAALLGGFVGYSIANDIVVTNLWYAPLQMAEQAGVIFQGTFQRTKSTYVISQIVSTGATSGLLAAAGAIAVRARPHELTAPFLRKRMHHFQLIFLCASVLLVLMAIYIKAMIAWPQGLLRPDEAKLFGAVGSALAGHAGASATVSLICAMLPATLSLKADIDLAATRACEDEGGRGDWRQKNGLEFAPMSVLGAAIATAAPMLAGPATDIIRSVFH